MAGEVNSLDSDFLTTGRALHLVDVWSASDLDGFEASWAEFRSLLRIGTVKRLGLFKNFDCYLDFAPISLAHDILLKRLLDEPALKFKNAHFYADP